MLKRLYEKNNRPAELEQICSMLRDGALVIYPTDTLYAIGCSALAVRAVERICTIKKVDPRKNNLSVLCRDFSQAAEYARISDRVFRLMKKNLPGPFTFILPTGSKLPHIFRLRKEVGIRIPACPVLKELLEVAEVPLLSMSVPAEEDDEPAFRTDPELIYERWAGEVDLVIDGGIAPGVPSTVVDCTGEEVEIVRQGAGVLQD